ncbi:MAG TPA: DUF6438 domain-containing protein [Coleofasciculaceae cyanobacterium]|jgi:hypothetical protein
MKPIFMSVFCLALAVGSPMLVAATPSGRPTADRPVTDVKPEVKAEVEAEEPAAAANETVITLERTACYGPCPVYELTVYGDGKVVYEGRAFVAAQGRRTAQISPEQVQQLVTAFETANFFALKDQYAVEVTDLPGAWTSIRLNGQSKRVWRYGSIDNPELNNAPRSLSDLESQIDQIVNSQQWIGN